MDDDHDPGRVGAVGVVPADVADASVAGRLDRRAAAARRRCRCRCGSGRSRCRGRSPDRSCSRTRRSPCRPSASVSVPLYWDGMLPSAYCLLDEVRRSLLRAPAGPSAVVAIALARSFLFLRSFAYAALLDRQRPGAVSFSSCLSRAWAVLELDELRVELCLLLLRVSARSVSVWARVVVDRLVDRGERLLVPDDLLGEHLVLLGEVVDVADLGDDVGERAARQERLEERRPVGVVGLADPLGEQLPCARRARTALAPPPGSRVRELVVEELELGDEREVLLLDGLDPDDHLVDRLADRPGRR